MERRIVLFILIVIIHTTGAQFLDALLIGMSWTLKETKVRQNALTDIKFKVVVNASDESQEVRGTGLWDVVVFGSTHPKGRGKRFDERPNLLTASQQATPTIPGGSMVFNDVATPFKLSVLGCSEYKYLCLEFKQGDDPEPNFFFASMDFEETIIVCAKITCEQGTGGPKDVMLIGMSWIVDAYVRQGVPSDVTITSSIQISHNHGGAEGEDLWRMKLFINSQKDGMGESLPQRRDQILNSTEASKDIQPGQKINITGTASIDLTGVGCGKFRFLCIEFGKGSDPKPKDFVFTLGSGDSTMVSCRELSCPDNRREDPGTVADGTVNDSDRGGSVFRVDDIAWEMTARDVTIGQPSDLVINLIVYVADDSDFITGSNLWRVGIYGSESPDGSTSLRSNYVRQILPGSQRNQLFAQGLDTVMMIRTMYDVSHVGCGTFRYICLEFTKNDLATPDFEIISDMGGVLSSCQQARCIRPKPKSEPTRIPIALSGLKTFYLSSMDWQMRAHISKTHLSNFLVDIFITADPSSNDISGTALWRVAMFGSRNSDGSGQRLDISDQILPVNYQSLPYTKTTPLQFTGIRGSEDMRGMYCTDIRYICIELGKHRQPNPDFNFYAGEAETFASCQEIPCENPEGRTTWNNANNDSDNSNGGRGGTGHGGAGGHGGPGGHPGTDEHGSQGHGSTNMRRGGGEPAVGQPIYEGGIITACTVAGIKIEVGETKAVSPCQTCRCSSGGVVICIELSCLRPLTCNEPVFIAEKCCATCLGEEAPPRDNLPCIFNDQIVLHNQEFRTSDCQQFTCQDGAMTSINTCAQSRESVEGNVTLSTIPPSLAVHVVNTKVLSPPPVYQRDVNIIKISVRVEFDNELSTSISGQNLWSLQVWGSLKANGGGPKLSYTRNALSPSQRSQAFTLNEEFVFRDVSVMLNMSSKTCKQLKYVCVMVLKSTSPPFYFTLTKSNSKANVNCHRLACIK